MVKLLVAVSLLMLSTSVLGQTTSTATSVSTVTVSTTTLTPTPTPAPAPACLCNDDPPPPAKNETQFSCRQQKEFGKCNADFMLGFCECTCDRCCPCNDFPPTGEEFTCLQQKEFGKCDADFMSGFCECTCDRCPALTGGPVTTPVIDGCPKGQVPIFGSSDCETVRCAQNRQKCANTCGGLTLIKFDCEDTTSGGSTAFSSSCACA